MSQQIAFTLIILCLLAAGLLLWRVLRRRRRPAGRNLRIDLFSDTEQ